MLAPACLSSICSYHQSEVHHKLVGRLLFSSLLPSMLFLLFSSLISFFSLYFCTFFIHYYFTSLPSFITYNSIISLLSAMPSVPARSPSYPGQPCLLFLLFLCPVVLSRGTAVQVFLPEKSSVSSSKYLSLCLFVSLCALVHEVECNIRNSDFVHVSFPFLSPLPPSLPYILHILLVLEQCYSLSLITN